MIQTFRRPRTLLPLVGREHELAALAESSSRAPAVVVLDGEAGIGKTRLVRALASDAAADGRRVLIGRCHRMRDPFELCPIIDALRTLTDAATPMTNPVLGALRPLLPELAQLLPPQPAPVGDASAQRHRLFRALRELLAGLDDALCVLEDLQWADESTLEFLAFLLSDPPPKLVLVLTYRTEQLDPSSALMGLMAGIPADAQRFALQLQPLCVADVGRFAATFVGREAVSQNVAARLHEWTGGIPNAVGHVLRLLDERGELEDCLRDAGSGLDDIRVPPSIRDSVLARVAHVGADAAAIMHAAAVLATPADEVLLSQVAALPASRGAAGLVEALATGIVTERADGLYHMRHRLAEKTVYESIAGPRRRRLHLRAGRALQSAAQPPLADIARQLRRADAAGSLRYAEDAAAAARARGDDLAASRLLEGALEAPDLTREERLRVTLSLGDAAFHGASPERAIGIIRRMLEEDPIAPAARGELRFMLALLLANAGEACVWRDTAVTAIAELPPHSEQAVSAMLNLARADDREGDLDDHMAWLERAVDAASQLGDPETRIAALSQRAAILLSVGDRRGWRAVREIPSTAVTAREKQQLLRGYHAIAAAALGLGYHDRAEALLTDADRIYAEVGRRSAGLWLMTTRASIDWYGGRWTGLEDRLYSLREETITTPAMHACNQFVLGALLLARGRLTAADETLRSALETTRRIGVLPMLVTVSGRLARLQLECGDAAAAWRSAAVGIEAVRSKDTWLVARTVVPEAVTALVSLEQPHEARALVAEFASGLSGRDAPAARAALSGSRGALAAAAGRHNSAAGHFARAEAQWRRLGSRYEAARARERRAGCLLQRPGKEAGREQLVEALGMYRALEAVGDARRVRAQLIAQGVWRGGRRGYGDELSPREAQVARLAGSGARNREIAEALFISPRTVEVHVASALHKLGLRSRHALGAVVATEGDQASKDT